MICARALRLAAPPLGVALALAMAGTAAAATCPPPRHLPWLPNNQGDCKQDVPKVATYPTQGATDTIHPGISAPCMTHLPGGVVLCAGGETAPQWSNGPNMWVRGRAIFRFSGSDPSHPGGYNIVVSASITETPNAPELLPALAADALVHLPPNTVLMRLADTATGRFVVVPDGHIRLAGLYKVLRRGVPPIPPAAAPAAPNTLPETGGSPLGTALTLAILLALAGLWLDPALPGLRGRRLRALSSRERAGLGLVAAGVLLAVTGGAVYAYQSTQAVSAEFGAFDATATGPVPHAGAAGGAPTRLVIPRMGLDTRIITLNVVGGAWQVPAYAAGYLAGSALPGTAGNEVITAHDDRDGSEFQRLGDLRAGDTIQVYAGAQSYRYAVFAARVVPPTRVSVLAPTHDAVLTLITCTPYLVDTERLVVRARLLP